MSTATIRPLVPAQAGVILGPEAIEQYLLDHAEELSQPEHRFGMWKDTEGGIYWLDVSIVVDSEAEAGEISLNRNQLAIYNLGEGEEIELQSREEQIRREQEEADRDGGGARGEPEKQGLQGTGPSLVRDGDRGSTRETDTQTGTRRVEPGGREEIWDVQGGVEWDDKQRGPNDDRQFASARNLGRQHQEDHRGLDVARLRSEVAARLRNAGADTTEVVGWSPHMRG